MIKQKHRNLSYSSYYDRILGCWIGKSLGGIVGAPMEGHKILGDFTAENSWPNAIAPNDDLDIQVVWLEMLEEHGPDFGYDDLIHFWQDRCWYNFAEYGYFLYNVQRGIHPPLSGDFNNNYFKESMGCPIRSEIWSLVATGNPELAAGFAKLDGTLDHIDDSVWSEQFWAACGSEAFFTRDLNKIIATGRSVIPNDSDIFRISTEVESLFAHEIAMKDAWLEMVRRYGNRDSSKVHINFAFTLASLYLGKGDVKETIVAAINLGWDTDCTAATAAALLGIMHGARSMPADWMEKMGKDLTSDVNVKHKTTPLTDFARDTAMTGLEMMRQKNPAVEITAIPPAIGAEVEKKMMQRAPAAAVEITAEYPKGPSLFRDRSSEMTITVRNRTRKKITGTLAVDAAPELGLPAKKISVSLNAGASKPVSISAQPSYKQDIIWDKNTFTAVWKDNTGYTKEKIFGFSGSRQWKVYGPYWDIWDSRTAEVCPFRNANEICIPWHAGCGRSATHQYVRMDKPYLDEEKILKEDITSERPVVVEAPEDIITSRDVNGFMGEAVYYFVREIVSRETIQCKLAIGSTAPFTAWLDGRKILSQEQYLSWMPQNAEAEVSFTTKPQRLVIKVANEMDTFQLSVSVLKVLKDIYGDKTEGVSFLVDSLGDVAR